MMHRLLLMTILLLLTAASHAQKVHVYGSTTHGGKALPGVLVMVFEQDRFYKKLLSNKNGEFQFFIGDRDYFILFYLPGMRPEAYHIITNTEANLLMIPLNMDMQAAERDPDSVLVHSPLLTASNPEIVRAYMTAVYDYERPLHDSISERTRHTLLRKAIEERDRFAHYRKSTVHTADRDSADRTSITIGPDTYDLITDAKGEKKYYKNQKPITELTYTYETTRRYEGVLKNKRDVRRFEKYRAMDHVKGK